MQTLRLPDEVEVVNVGLALFGEAVRAQGALAVDVDSKEPDGGLWGAAWDGKAWSGPLPLGMGPMASEPTVGIDSTGHGWAYWKGPDGKLRESFFDGVKWNGPIALPQFGVAHQAEMRRDTHQRQRRRLFIADALGRRI